MAGRNAEVSAALHEVADLLELKGADRYRILGYRRAADVVEGLPGDVCDLSAAELQAIRGVGKGVAARVAEFCSTGRIPMLDALREEVPPGMRQLTSIPGLGPKRAMLAFRELGIATVEELRDAAEAHRLRDVKGFGARSEEQILDALRRGVTEERRLLLARALPLAQSLVAELEGCDAVTRCAYAGSIRRMRETIGDIDLLVASERPAEVMESVRSLSSVRAARAEGPSRTTVVTTRGVQVDVRVVAPDVFGAALQYFTGSQAHNVKLREHAVRKGFKLSEYGLHGVSSGELVASRTEEEVYEKLGMQWIPPTMREDHGEVEAALRGELPGVVAVEDLVGDLQSHSTYSDGRSSVRDMASAAADRGYRYFAVTDHGPRLTYMKTLGLAEIERQRREIDEVNAELRDRMTLLHGVELNIDADGSLDYAPDVLERFDVCVASIHSQFRLSRDDQTRRLLKAIENPRVHVIGHPSGRRLDRREGIDFDVREVARAAARHRVALEINAHPYRLDLRDEHVAWARGEGATFVISTDAHSIAELENIHFGVATAQRGWAGPDEVMNTWPLTRLRGFLAKR